MALLLDLICLPTTIGIISDLLVSRSSAFVFISIQNLVEPMKM